MRFDSRFPEGFHGSSAKFKVQILTASGKNKTLYITAPSGVSAAAKAQQKYPGSQIDHVEQA